MSRLARHDAGPSCWFTAAAIPGRAHPVELRNPSDVLPATSGCYSAAVGPGKREGSMTACQAGDCFLIGAAHS